MVSEAQVYAGSPFSCSCTQYLVSWLLLCRLPERSPSAWCASCKHGLQTPVVQTGLKSSNWTDLPLSRTGICSSEDIWNKVIAESADVNTRRFVLPRTQNAAPIARRTGASRAALCTRNNGGMFLINGHLVCDCSGEWSLGRSAVFSVRALLKSLGLSGNRYHKAVDLMRGQESISMATINGAWLCVWVLFSNAVATYTSKKCCKHILAIMSRHNITL